MWVPSPLGAPHRVLSHRGWHPELAVHSGTRDFLNVYTQHVHFLNDVGHFHVWPASERLA